MTYSDAFRFTLSTVAEPDTKGNDKLGRRRKESAIEPKSGADASGRLLAEGGDPTLLGVPSPFFVGENAPLNPPITEDANSQLGVRFDLPFRGCEDCGRKTGWIATYGKFNSHRTCAKCMSPIHRRLVENIYLVNDGKEPLPLMPVRGEA